MIQSAASESLYGILLNIRSSTLNRVVRERIDRVLNAGIDMADDSMLARTLLSHGIDHPLVHDWWICHIHRVSAAAPRPSKLATLLDLREEISAILVTGDPCFGKIAVKTLVLAAIDEAFRFSVMRHLTQPQEKEHKIGVNLSVAEIALLLKAFFSQGMFRTENQRSLFRALAAGLSSKRQGSFSSRNLSKEYYAPAQVTAANVRSLLLRMADALAKEFFPIISAALLAHTF